jgi:hypothetical protein
MNEEVVMSAWCSKIESFNSSDRRRVDGFLAPENDIPGTKSLGNRLDESPETENPVQKNWRRDVESGPGEVERLILLNNEGKSLAEERTVPPMARRGEHGGSLYINEAVELGNRWLTSREVFLDRPR